MMRLAIIGGTGLSQLGEMQIRNRQVVVTPWGEPSAPVLHGVIAGRQVTFLPRHGSGHTIPPHQVNYRANLWALKEIGIGEVIAVNAVGGIRDDMLPGNIAVPDQLIDYTWGRPHTYFEGADRPVRHVDFTRPYSGAIRARLIDAGARAGMPVIDGGTYGATQGPRLESAAEIARLARDGCAMVGMTGMPEAALARELDLEYACCAMVVNRAAGRGGDIHEELDQYLEQGLAAVRLLLESLLREPEVA